MTREQICKVCSRAALTLQTFVMPGLVAAILLTLTARLAQAQGRTSVNFSVGQFQYDAGLDQWYSLLRLAVSRRITPGISIGLAASRAEIGEIKHWFAFPTDETVYHGFASVEGRLIRPFKTGRVPPFDRLSFGITTNAGMVRSSGVELDSAVLQDPFHFATDDREGFAWGGSASVSLDLGRNLSLTADMLYWRDQLFGGKLDDFERTVGVSLSW